MNASYFSAMLGSTLDSNFASVHAAFEEAHTFFYVHLGSVQSLRLLM